MAAGTCNHARPGRRRTRKPPATTNATKSAWTMTTRSASLAKSMEEMCCRGQPNVGTSGRAAPRRRGRGGGRPGARLRKRIESTTHGPQSATAASTWRNAAMAPNNPKPNQTQKPKGTENVKDLPEKAPGKSTQDNVKG